MIRPAVESDAESIARIYNQGIEERRSTFETRLRTVDDTRAWLTPAARYPVLVIDTGGGIGGWANLSNYRPRACYDGNAEFSIYVDRACRGRGYGALLLQALIDEARGRGYYKLISRIFTDNQASLALCRRLGFREVGTYLRHGQLDGVWRDVVIVERWLPEEA
nr:arsinothricin resistance N-acetyltransferase ArsN1 family A [Lysobacter sp. CAU 1642]